MTAVAMKRIQMAPQRADQQLLKNPTCPDELINNIIVIFTIHHTCVINFILIVIEFASDLVTMMVRN